MMDRRDERIGLTGNNRAALDHLTGLLICPALPQPRKRHRRTVPAADIVRQARIHRSLPLVKPGHRNQATAPFEGGSECRLGPYGLGARIDQSIPDLGVLSTERDQAPAQEHKLAVSIL